MDFAALNNSPSQHTDTIRRSVSSLNVTFVNPVCAVRESHSFTDGMNIMQQKVIIHSSLNDIRAKNIFISFGSQ